MTIKKDLYNRILWLDDIRNKCTYANFLLLKKKNKSIKENLLVPCFCGQQHLLP